MCEAIASPDDVGFAESENGGKYISARAVLFRTGDDRGGSGWLAFLWRAFLHAPLLVLTAL
jgi:hypothetical protein